MSAVLAAMMYGKNVNILQHLQSYRRSGANAKRFLTPRIEF